MKPRLRVVGAVLLFSFFFLGQTNLSFGQISCPQCDAVCPGSSLADYINLGSETITDINGDYNGGGTLILEDYFFPASGTGQIIIEYENIDSQTIDYEVLSNDYTFTINCQSSTVTFQVTNPNLPDGFDYTWILNQTSQGSTTQIGSNTGVTASIPIPSPLHGEYSIQLSTNYGNNCVLFDDVISISDLVGIQPSLEFFSNGEAIQLESNGYVLGICGNSDEIFDITVNNTSTGQQLGEFTFEYIIDGIPENSDPLLTHDLEADGEYEVCLVATNNDGCTAERCYYLLFADLFIDFGFGVVVSGSIQCAPDDNGTIDGIIDLEPGIENPPGSTYQVEIYCGTQLIDSYYYGIQDAVPATIQVPLNQSSCNCLYSGTSFDSYSNYDHEYLVLARSFHPCLGEEGDEDGVKVNIDLDAGISFAEDTMCVGESQTFCFSDYPGADPEIWCQVTPIWDVFCPDGTTNCTSLSGSEEECITVDFNDPGMYTIELYGNIANNDCPDDSTSVTICVNPDINTLNPTADWNIPDPLCTGVSFSPEVLYDQSLVTCDDPEIDWELTGPVNIEWTDVQSIDINDLPVGTYTLSVSATIDDCPFDWQTDTTFTVMGGPRIDSNIVDIPCVGAQNVVFDNWFCIEDSLSELTSLIVQLFESPDCDLSGLSPEPDWIGDPSEYDPCANDFGDDFVWSEADAGDFVLLIIAENDCQTDSLCIPFEIEEPEPLTFENIESDYCINEIVDLTIFAEDNTPPGVDMGDFTFSCPDPGDCPGDILYGNNSTWNTSSYPPGDYTITFSMDCYESVDTMITLHENPIIDLGPSPVVICDEDTVLSPTVVNSLTLDPASCNWTYPGGPSSNCDLNLTAPITPGTYIFSGETEFGCPDSASLEIDIEEFQIDGSNLIISCNQAGLDLIQLSYTQPVSPGNIFWQICDATGSNCNTEIPDGAGIIDISNYSEGDYQLQWNYTSILGCDYSGIIDFEIGDLNNPDFSSDEIEECLGEIIQINESTSLNGAWSIIDCPGGSPCSETFSSDNSQFSWDTDGGNGEPGQYLVEYSGVCIDPDTVPIILNNIPSFNVIGIPQVCQDSLVQLTTDYIGTGTFSWTSNTDELILDNTSPSASVDGQQNPSSTYTLTVTEDGCDGSASLTVNHELQPWTDLNESFSFCDDSITCVNLDSILISNGWSNPAGQWTVQPNGAIIGSSNLDCANFQLLDPNTYDLVFEYTSSLNCPFDDTLSLDITDLQSIQFNTNTGTDSICAGLTYSPDINLDPLLPEISATLISCPPVVSNCGIEIDLNTHVFNEPGTYSILLDGTCYADTIIDLVVNPIPEFVVNTANGLEICPGDPITLEIDYDEPNFGCEWIDLNSGSPVSANTDCSITVSPSETTEYQAVVDDLGCTDTTTVEVIVLEDTLNLNCTAWNDTICANDTICLDIQDLLIGEDVSAPNFTWFLNNEILSATSFCVDTLPADSTYYIKYEYIFSNNLNTCTFQDSCSFYIEDLAPTNLQYENQLLTDTIKICLGDGISIESGTTDTLGTWSIIDYPPDCYPSNADTLDPFTFEWNTDAPENCPGIYTVMYTAVCKDTVLATIEVFPNPDVNIQIDPGELICEDNSVTITVDYIGENTVINVWLDPDATIAGDEISPVFLSETQFEWNINSGAIADSYTLYLEDEAPCPFEEEIQIDIQQVDFGLTLCNTMQDFCSNSDTLIILEDLITDPIPVGGFTWYIVDQNDVTTDISDGFNPSDYEAGDYHIYYDFQHGESPNCIFSDTCSFTIGGLNPVIINSEVGYCLGSTNTITASYPPEYSGAWEVIEGDANCLTIIQDEPNTFQFIANCLGPYTIEFAGECLETQIISFEVLSIPNIEWTPEDLTPCQNECLEFEADLIENADVFQWTYDGNVETSPLCFQDGNPGTLCLEATTIHNLLGQIIECNDSICEVLDPIESPGGVDLTDLDSICAGEPIYIDSYVDLNLYGSCNFNLPPFPQVPCDQPLDTDQNGPYGPFNYELILTYGDGCQDIYEGPIFIPEPPSSDFSMVYDSCDAEVLVDLPGLQGDDLSFNWTVEADTSDFTSIDFEPIDILDDNTTTLPVPNPIPLGNAGFVQDTPFIVGVTISNPSCDFFPWYILQHADTGLYVSPPVLDIDVFNGTGEPICTPTELTFQANIANTNILDSLAWSIIYVDELIYEETADNESLTPLFLFENTNIAGVDTIFVSATAWNRCGSMTTTEEFYVLPDSVYFEIPPSLPGTCNGENLTFNADPLIGEESIDQIILGSDPIIPGLSWSSPDSVTFNVFIPETTPAGEYRLGLTMIGCGEETDSLDIFIFPDPEIAFSVVNESCTGVPVFFENQTDGAAEFFWDFGDGSNPEYNEIPSPEHVYNQPGTYYPTLTAISDQGCTIQLTDSISIYGPDASFELDEFMICSGEQVNYDFNQQENIISVEWEFLLPGVDTIISVADTNTFITMYNETDEVQFWTLSLTLQDIFGCTSQDETELIVFPQPHAFFTHSTLQDCIQGDEIEFYNESTAGSAAFWNFGDPESGLLNQTNVFNPTHVFSGVGQYTVTLTVTNSYFCTDEYRRLLRCNNLSLYVPNAFTPDENGFNDVFKPVIYGIEDIQFEKSDYYTFEIFNRWGERVFMTHDHQKGWNGQSPNGEYYSQSEVFNWRVNIIFPDGAEDWVGTVTLVR